jgi:N-acetylneuraminate synthase
LRDFSIKGINFNDIKTPILVAELGINHGGNLESAIQLASSALEAGYKFIKHQTHIPSAEMSEEAKSVFPGNAQESIYDVISNNYLKEDEEYELMKFVVSKGGIFFSTPFSREAADRLENWDVPLFKIGSGECNNYPLVEHIAKKNRPVILSTGMNTIHSISKSVEILENFRVPYALLHTTNLYPTPARLVRLGAMLEMKEAFPRALIGLSDHTIGNTSAIAAVALGAKIIEKHFTDTYERVGPDISSSIDYEDSLKLIQSINETVQLLGGKKSASAEEAVTINFAFASVVVIKSIKKGEVLSAKNIWVKRPSGGDFGPDDLYKLYGLKVKEDLSPGYQLKRRSVEF